MSCQGSRGAILRARSACLAALPLMLASAPICAQGGPPAAGDASRYEIEDHVLIRTADGATLSATVVRPRAGAPRLPALLTLDIYTDPAEYIRRCEDAADHGYVGVIADTRGKRLSRDPIVPYEHEASDADAVIEWIAKQPWSNGEVGMRGGSYSGFSAWAAAKHLPAALRTIAVSAAAIPGLGLPMYNNVFLNANYGWGFYVSDNTLLDEKTYGDASRWQQLPVRWFASGRRYRDIDRIDGTPNPLLQRWLDHPAFDAYWQAMVPWKSDFARIDIPVLTITGYYDDGQISALEYVRQHYRFNPHARHYVVIGPYDHFGTHRAHKADVLRGYAIDPVAQFSTPGLVYEWMDYVLRGAAKPALLEDRINFEVMGGNAWQHAPSIERMAPSRLTLYFSDARQSDRFRLTPTKPPPGHRLEQTVDLADRSVETNLHYYPDPIIEKTLERPTELRFISAPFKEGQVVSGSFTGELEVTLNKKDADLGVTIFEELPDGRLFHLAYWLGRASFAADPEVRTLLVPGRATRIPFTTTVVSRLLNPGSRLLVLLDVDKNRFAQVNYGTGKDVSAESVADAGEPLRVSWHSDSFIEVPLGRR
ncbi:MAG TPA: CocE/NonD family hydrolase [Steroidobacteraceae bacterium]|nr:CocE/NonD family hydrolase [Steroidobacteraceae bacterium]